MKKYVSYRLVNLYAALLVVALLLASAHLQFNVGLEPCPLCVIQRLILMVLGILFFGGAIHVHTPFWRKIYCSTILIFALLGLGIAWRHVWLTYLPIEQTSSCGASLDFLLNNLPWLDAARAIFHGSGDCARVTWTFLRFSIPEWTLGFFVVFALVALWQLFRKKV